MATVDLQFNLLDALAPSSMKRAKREIKPAAHKRKFSLPVEQADHAVNRIAFVREQQEMTLRSVSRHTGIDVRTLRCLLYTSPSPRDLSTSRMPSSA